MYVFEVDFMLGSYMEDIGITPKQFEDACGKGSKKSFQHGLFEQVCRQCSEDVIVMSVTPVIDCVPCFLRAGVGCG